MPVTNHNKAYLALLSGGRMEDMGRCERVDRSLLEGELIAARAQEAGLQARHKGILIERCRGDDIVIVPDGICGNLIFRTLLLFSILIIVSTTSAASKLTVDGVGYDNATNIVEKNRLMAFVDEAAAYVKDNGKSGKQIPIP